VTTVTDAPPVTDAVLIGAGIMSTTLAAILRKLDPNLTIEVFERLDAAAAESSDAWNNAGTGHSGFCELNYTPEAADGSVDVSRAILIAEQFELSKQLWVSLVEDGSLREPWRFVRNVPHVSFVRGEADVRYLQKRYAGLVGSPLFERMEYSEDRREIASWIPLVMEGAPGDVPVAVLGSRLWRSGGTGFAAARCASAARSPSYDARGVRARDLRPDRRARVGPAVIGAF
jgi:malate dehydrogenase (quinone)